MIRNITRSLSARLLAIFIVTSIIYAVASRFAVDLVLDRDYLREIVGAHIALHTNYVLSDLGSPPDIQRAEAIARDNPVDIRIEGPDIIWSSNPDFPPLADLPFGDSEFIERLKQTSGDDPWSETLRNVFIARHDSHSFVKITRGDYDISFVTPKIAVVPPPNLTNSIIGVLSILVLAGCYFSVRWLVRPIKWIKEGAGRIGQGELDYRIPKVRNDDLGELTSDINRMAEDVEEMLEAKRQLLLAISHELRSPLTRTRVALEFLDNEKIRRDILEDVEEMERLIDDLLEGERLNSRHSKLQISTVDLNRLIRELVETDFQNDLDRLRIDFPEQVITRDLDATRLRLLIKNLLDNALCYTSADAPPVEVMLREDPEAVVISVRDHGPGMSRTQVERATEPFYRADPARCRDTGGFGLGLYLCRRIAEAHGGQLEIRSEEGQGTVVRVCLPAASRLSVAA